MIRLEALLAPIPGEPRQGADLRKPVPHGALQEFLDASMKARRDEQAQAADPSRSPDWGAVEKRGQAILTERSKDLEVASLYIEALVRNAGFAGLAAGGELISGLVRHYWPALFPDPDQDDDRSPEAVRLQTLGHIASGPQGRLLPAIRQVELFVLPSGTSFSYYGCKQSKEWTALSPDRRSKHLAGLTPQHRAEQEKSAGTQVWPAVLQAARAGHSASLSALHGDLTAALTNWRAAAEAIDAAAGPGAFSAEDLLTLIRDVQRTVAEIVPPPADAPEAPAAAAPVAQQPAQTVMAGLATRDDGLRQLAEVTAFFRRTEPHSPLVYTLEEAMRRAQLTWPELLAELVPDRAQRDTIQARLGIRSEPAPP